MMMPVGTTLTKRIVIVGSVTFAALAPMERGTAQRGSSAPAGEAFGYLDLAVPVGAFQGHVDLGGGAGFGGVLLGADGLVGLRAEGHFIIYGAESRRVPLSPTVPFVDVDVQTTNSIFSAGLGPQIYLGRGPIRPYVYGTAGFAYFVTSTSVNGSHGDEPIASTTNFDDFRWAFTGGGGLSIRVRGGENPLSLDLSASYQRNGMTEYLADGAANLRRLGRGNWVADPIVSDANLMTYRVGVSVGIG